MRKRARSIRNIGAPPAFALLLVAILTLGQFGFSQDPQYGGVLRVGQSVDLLSLDPHEDNFADGAMLHQVFNSLVKLSTEDLEPQPELAESWQFSDNGGTLTFALRKGVLFHDGTELTASDVAANIARVQDPEVGSKLRSGSLLIGSVETPDDHTLVVHLTEPTPTIMDFFSKLMIAKPESLLDPTRAVGTGAFSFVEWVPGDHVTLQRFDNYWREGLPYLDGIEIKILPDEESIVANLRAGAIDMGRRIVQSAAENLASDPNFEIFVSPHGSVYFSLGFVVTSPPLDNRDVRQALNMSIDRERFQTVFLKGFGTTTCIPWPKSSPAYNETLATGCYFDLEGARTLLSGAGYADGFSLTAEVAPTVTPETLRLLQLWQQDLQQLNIRLDIQQISGAQYSQKKQAGEFTQIWADSFSGTNRHPAIPFLSSRPFMPGVNPSHFASPEYDALIERLTTEQDPEAMHEAAQEMTALLANEAFINPYMSKPGIWAYTTRLHGRSEDIGERDILEQAWLERP